MEKNQIPETDNGQAWLFVFTGHRGPPWVL